MFSGKGDAINCKMHAWLSNRFSGKNNRYITTGIVNIQNKFLCMNTNQHKTKNLNY